MSRACPAALRPKVGLPKWSALQAMFRGRERERQMHAMVSERSRKKKSMSPPTRTSKQYFPLASQEPLCKELFRRSSWHKRFVIESSRSRELRKSRIQELENSRTREFQKSRIHRIKRSESRQPRNARAQELESSGTQVLRNSRAQELENSWTRAACWQHAGSMLAASWQHPGSVLAAS